MKIGAIVNGIDLKGNEVNNGVVENVLRTFGVAIVRVGEDRTDVTQAHISELQESSQDVI